jgi:hypothetical protein
MYLNRKKKVVTQIHKEFHIALTNTQRWTPVVSTAICTVAVWAVTYPILAVFTTRTSARLAPKTIYTLCQKKKKNKKNKAKKMICNTKVLNETMRLVIQ